MLFNAYCNKYQTGDKQGVLDFAKEHGSKIWADPLIQKIAIGLSTSECVGNGANDAPPHPEVKYAIEILQNELGIDHDTVCKKNCRLSKQKVCVGITSKEFSPPVTPIMSLYRIVYQIRCNLFHGDKVDLDAFQMERDEFLVDRSTSLTNTTLAYISTLPTI
jgi:hypothetical protein